MTFENLSEKDIEELLAKVENSKGPKISRAEFSELEAGKRNTEKLPLELLGDIEVELEVELGTATRKLREVLEMREDTVIRLDTVAGEPAEVYLNGHLFGNGEIAVVNDAFGVKFNRIYSEGNSNQEKGQENE